MSKSIIILGGNALNAGVVDKFRSLGYQIVVVDFREDIRLSVDMHILFDATDPRVVDAIRQRSLNVCGVYTSMDNAGLAQKAICSAYGLHCATEEALAFAHHKDLMHRKWQENKLLGRKSFALGKFDPECIQALNSQEKIIIKPTDSCASRGITIIPEKASVSALERSFTLAMQASGSGLVNIEEFVEGQEFTVEMLGDAAGNVSVYGISKKYHTHNTDNNKIAVKLHYNPNDVSPVILQEIADKARACYKALGLESTFGHLEMIRKKDGGLVPVEIGARSSGFIASHLAECASGRCYLEDLAAVQCGAKVHDGLLEQKDVSAMYFFYDIPDGGVSQKVSNLMEFINPNVHSVNWDRSRLQPRVHFEKITQDTDRYGHEILLGPRSILTIDEVVRAEKAFLEDFLQ